MIDMRQALLAGALAAEALAPKRVKDLEGFLAQYPEAWSALAMAMGVPDDYQAPGEEMPDMGTEFDMGMGPGMMEEYGAGTPGPEQGPEPFGL